MALNRKLLKEQLLNYSMEMSISNRIADGKRVNVAFAVINWKEGSLPHTPRH